MTLAHRFRGAIGLCPSSRGTGRFDGDDLPPQRFARRVIGRLRASRGSRRPHRRPGDGNNGKKDECFFLSRGRHARTVAHSRAGLVIAWTLAASKRRGDNSNDNCNNNNKNNDFKLISRITASLSLHRVTRHRAGVLQGSCLKLVAA